MAYNGSGTFTVVNTFVYDTVISETDVNTNFTDIATGLSTCLLKDGTQTVTANIPFATYKITGLGDGTAAQDATALHQIQDQDGIWCGTAGGTKNALTISPTPAITAYAAGQKFRAIIGGTSSDSTVTVAVSGLTTKDVQINGAACSATSFLESGKLYDFDYDGTQFQATRLSGVYLTSALARGHALAGNSSGVAAAVNISAASTALVGDGTDAVATGIRKQGLETVWVPSGAMVSRTTNGAASSTSESTTNKVMTKTLDFDTATQEFAQFNVRFPKSWNRGTVTFAPVWSAASGSGGVVWALQGVALSDDDAIDTAYGTEQTSTDTLITASDIHVGPTSSAITIAGTPAVGDWVSFQVKRNVSDGSDTLGVDAQLLGVVLLFTTSAGDDT